MNSKIINLVIIFFISVFLSGCAGAPLKYSFKENIFKSEPPLTHNIAIGLFEDIRPQEEHDASLRPKSLNAYTDDKILPSNVNREVCSLLAEHLKESKLANSSEIKELSDDIDKNIGQMELLKKDGIDIIIIGKLKHFYGYQEALPDGICCFGALGVLVEASSNPKTVGGKVEYTSVKFIDVGKKRVLWEGNFEYSFEKEEKWYKGAPAYALVALKEINNKLAEKLHALFVEESGR